MVVEFIRPFTCVATRRKESPQTIPVGTTPISLVSSDIAAWDRCWHRLRMLMLVVPKREPAGPSRTAGVSTLNAFYGFIVLPWIGPQSLTTYKPSGTRSYQKGVTTNFVCFFIPGPRIKYACE